MSQVYKFENADKSENAEKQFEEELNENKTENVEESLEPVHVKQAQKHQK